VRKSILRLTVLAAVLTAAAGALAWRMRASDADWPAVRLAWVAEAHQFGPVSYRDPAGAISPDAKWIAYSEGRFLRVRPLNGGPAIDLPPGAAQIRNLSWRPDSRAVLADGYRTQASWALYDIIARTATPFGSDAGLRSLTWSPDGKKIAGIVNGSEGQELRIVGGDGSPLESRRLDAIGFPAWTPNGEVACLATVRGRLRVTIPCGGRAIDTDPDLDAHGPIAFSSDGRAVYVGLSNGVTLDLFEVAIDSGRARRLTSFSRDTYAPTVAADGTVLFKVQSYRTVVALAPASGGPVLPLTAFQSETPSWDPTGHAIGITYGTWRRVIDDAHYPDIAQDAGIIEVDPAHPASAPTTIVHASPSEDQSLCWSPNGRWIAFHSHREQSDDIWLRPSSRDAAARRITFLGRGAETGWPRWSPDGRWLLFSGASRATHRTAIYAVGIDQESGNLAIEAHEIAIRGFEGEVTHAEWLPDSAHFVAIGKEGPGRHVILSASREGGDAHIVRRFASEHDAPGLAVSPDGHDVAFVAPAADGFFQIFRMPIGSTSGSEPVQVTTDPSNKTQPAWSPDGRSIALTVWNYDAQFFVIHR
jgi:Tol biopolymer transport system component